MNLYEKDFWACDQATVAPSSRSADAIAPLGYSWHGYTRVTGPTLPIYPLSPEVKTPSWDSPLIPLSSNKKSKASSDASDSLDPAEGGMKNKNKKRKTLKEQKRLKSGSDQSGDQHFLGLREAPQERCIA